MSGGGVFVTGGAGFIGSHLVRSLVQRGEQVTVFDNLSVGRRESVDPGAKLVVGDVTDADAVAHAMRGHRALVHLAARVAIRSSFDFAVQDTHTNVVGAASVMQAARLSGSVQRVVAASSMAVYADSGTATPVDESHETRPLSPYGISKLAMEQLVHTMAAAAGVHSSVLRLFNTYGPGQALSPYVGVVTIFAHALRDGQPPTIFGDGEQCRDFVHVADVVRAFLLVLGADDRAVRGRTFNVGSGTATSVGQLYRLVREALGSSVAPRHLPAVPGELRHSVADIRRVNEAVRFAPEHVLGESLREVVVEIARG